MDINLSILDIDNNRVGTEGGTKKINIVERKIDRPSFCSNSQKDKFMIDNRTGKLDAGRFPAQMFISTDIGNMIDEQSGEKKGTSKCKDGINKKLNINNNLVMNANKIMRSGFDDKGGASKILNKIDFTEEDEY